MKKTVVLDLDSLDRSLMHTFMREGRLPNLSKLMEQGTYWPLQNEPLFIAEIAHSVYYTGQRPKTMKYWGPIKYEADSYRVRQTGGLQPGKNARLFWELKDKARVTVFDNPQSWLSNDCQGTQIYGWGYHGPKGENGSSPKDLLGQIQKKYGNHLAFPRDNANLTQPETVYDLAERLIKSSKIRTAITLDLLENTDWDLFVASFSETHSAPHYVFGALYLGKSFDQEKIRQAHIDIYKSADAYVGAIMDKLDPDTNLLVLSIEGMQSNNQDIPSAALLPEWLYRWNFPGQKGMTYPEKEPAYWPEAKVWRSHLLPYLANATGLSTFLRRYLKPEAAVSWETRLSLPSVPFHPNTFKDFSYLPAMWYQPIWQRMKAFALPSFSDGAIRINLKGRDAHGIVSVEEYEAVCAELTELLWQVKLPGTNTPAATRITRTREHALDPDGPYPNADISVEWHRDFSTRFECPNFGIIGPLCPVRFGAHNSDGFLIACGPDLEAGAVRPSAKVVDVAPTVLDLLEVGHDMLFDGKALASANVPV